MLYTYSNYNSYIEMNKHVLNKRNMSSRPKNQGEKKKDIIIKIACLHKLVSPEE